MIEEQYEDTSKESNAFEYEKYMDVLVGQFAKTAISIMAIAQECGCESYEHIMNGYKIRICKWEEDECQTKN